MYDDPEVSSEVKLLLPSTAWVKVVRLSVWRSAATEADHFLNWVSLVTAFMFSMSSHWSAKSASAVLALGSASIRVACAATSDALTRLPPLAASINVWSGIERHRYSARRVASS